jgi:hypothetical protein
MMRSPLDVAKIQDKFVNTLLIQAEHLNRLRYCRDLWAAENSKTFMATFVSLFFYKLEFD